MAKITLDPITSGYQTTAQVNNNNADIVNHLNDKVLYRDNPAGEPNQMFNALDMNLNRIINLPNATGSDQPATFGQVITIISEAIAAASGDSGGGFGTEYLFWDVETVILAENQTLVTFGSDTTLSNFSRSGLSIDSGKMIEGVDFTKDNPTRTITLAQSYPAGTAINRYREKPDTSLPVEDAIAAAAASQEWATQVEDTLISLESGGNLIDDYSALHHASKAAASAAAALAVEGLAVNATAVGAVVLDAANGANSVFHLTFTGNITDLSITNTPVNATKAYSCTIIITSDGSSSVTFGSQFTFPGGTPPTLTLSAGKRDVITSLTIDNGAEFLSEVVMVGI